MKHSQVGRYLEHLFGLYGLETLKSIFVYICLFMVLTWQALELRPLHNLLCKQIDI